MLSGRDPGINTTTDLPNGEFFLLLYYITDMHSSHFYQISKEEAVNP